MKRQIMGRSAFTLLLMGMIAVLARPALAQKGPPPATGIVQGWVPNNGVLCSEDRSRGLCSTQTETYLGDMWTFRCPSGGTAFIWVDTKDDTDTVESCIDPVAHVFNSNGLLLASGDEDSTCSFLPVCGYQCPKFGLACVGNRRYSVVVRDFGDATVTAEQCDKGGGYILHVTIFDRNGLRVKPHRVKLGGGPARAVQKWMKSRHPTKGPLLDDEAVPSVMVVK